jgi:uncharacterized protein YebE (UPF0316 family)
MDAFWLSWVVIPLLIFSARVLDVSIGTMRIVYIARGKRLLAPLLGFFEVLIWLVAISQIFKHLDNIACYLAWAAGFATGNYVGMVIEKKLAIGIQVIRIITRFNADQLIGDLKSAGYGLTLLDGEGANGAVKIIFMLIKRKDLPHVKTLIKENNPKAFYTVEDVQFASDPVYPVQSMVTKRFYHHLLRMDRKSK